MTSVWGWNWFRNFFSFTDPLWSVGTPTAGSAPGAARADPGRSGDEGPAGPELAAGGVDVDAAVAANRRVDAPGPQPLGEGPEPGLGGGGAREVARRVERDEVHVGAADA